MKPVAVMLVLGLWTMTATAYAQGGNPDDLQVLDPLLNPDVPLLALWFCPSPQVPAASAENLQEFIYRKLFDRYDVRLLGRRHLGDKLAALDAGLGRCNCSDTCLEALGRGLECHRIIGVTLQPAGAALRLSIKSQIFSPKGTRQLNSVVEGSEATLLSGALEKALSAIFENESYHAPLDRARAEKKHPALAPPVAPVKKSKPKPQAAAVAAAPPSPPPVSAEAGQPVPGFLSRHRWSALTGGAALGCLAGALALGAMSERIEDQQHIQYDPGRDALGRRYATAANALFGVSAGAALGAVLIFFLVEKPAPARVTLSPAAGGALLQAAWSW